MSEVVEKLAASGHLTEEQVERIGRNTAEMLKAAQADPALMAELKKMANAAGFFEHLPWKQTAGTLLAAAGIQAAGNVVGDVYQGIKGSIQKARHYKGMMDANPHLAKMDAKRVQRSFDTLHKFNPDYASDPSVAGQFVQDSMELERVPIEQINQMVRARSDLASARRGESSFDVSRLPVGALNVAQSGLPEPAPSQEEQHAALLKRRAGMLKNVKEISEAQSGLTGGAGLKWDQPWTTGMKP